MEIKLAPQAWKEFCVTLDQPTVANPALRDLLTKPSVIEKVKR